MNERKLELVYDREETEKISRQFAPTQPFLRDPPPKNRVPRWRAAILGEDAADWEESSKMFVIVLFVLGVTLAVAGAFA